MSEYKLVWSDEFDRDGKPDSNKWTYELGGHGFGNREAQTYTDELQNAYVKDQMLHIQAIKTLDETKPYTSARLTTFGKTSWQYGRFLIRAKLPKGKGTWPAIWMLSDSIKHGKRWPLCGEIDIMEHVGRDQDMIHFSLHSETYNHVKKTHRTEYRRFNQVSEEFHEYGIEWLEGSIEFFVDGVSYAKFTKDTGDTEKEWPFDQPFYLILNLAIGGNWGGVIDDEIFPTELVIDYVRVYQK